MTTSWPPGVSALDVSVVPRGRDNKQIVVLRALYYVYKSNKKYYKKYQVLQMYRIAFCAYML